jgi:hypothetical protein
MSGGRAMLLAAKNFDKIDEKNFEDNLGYMIDIPTVIIDKTDADKIKKVLEDKKTVLLSIKYAGVKTGEGETFLMEMFLRSDDIKSLHFFREFKYYYDTLSKENIFKIY